MNVMKRKKKKPKTIILPIAFEVSAPWTWSKEFCRGWDEATRTLYQIWLRMDVERMTHKKRSQR
jgi:hypothetical protein